VARLLVALLSLAALTVRVALLTTLLAVRLALLTLAALLLLLLLFAFALLVAALLLTGVLLLVGSFLGHRVFLSKLEPWPKPASAQSYDRATRRFAKANIGTRIRIAAGHKSRRGLPAPLR